MTFTLKIKMDNAAFQPAPGLELAAILRGLAVNVEEAGPGEDGPIIDVNGNTCGEWKISKR